MPPDTHTVLNQSTPYRDVNLFTSDRVLRAAVEREGGSEAVPRLMTLGATAGSAEAFERGRLANENPPKLRAFDDKGRRLDIVEYHPAYHECMALSVAEGLHCGSFEPLKDGGGPRPGANVARAAGSYVVAQMEAGHCCPITMTNASIATLRLQPEIARQWLPRILTRSYDPRFRPSAEKTGVTIGMGMTEKQGGTDVRANTTRAEPAGNGGPGGEFLLTGHKWFLSAPMSDAFLMLAQTGKGPSCFLVPRFLPDGSVNPLRFQRLKAKLGNRSNASSEVEFDGVHGWLIGEEGRGVASIIEMVTCTRLDCTVSSAGLMRLCLATAIHNCSERQVFGKRLTEQPMMQSVLADLALDSEAATALAFRLARSFDQQGDAGEDAWRRVMTPVTKYWVCKIAPAFAYEAMECLGGNGYVEEGTLARVYREVPVNAIWEGSGNVMCLDVLRAVARDREPAARLLEQLVGETRGLPGAAAAAKGIADMLSSPEGERHARRAVEMLALLAATAALNATAPELAAAFAEARLERPFGFYGAAVLPAPLAERLMNRALPL